MKRTAFLFISCMLHVMWSAAQQKPNIVIILSDDHAFQAISAYGGGLMQTPNIDRIAQQGAIFKRAYVTNSICGPSRAVILTGKYSHINGFKDNANPRFEGRQDNFAKQLQTAGYQTAWIGKWHLGTKPQGFDFWQILPDQGAYYNPDFVMMDSSKQKFDGYVTNVIEDVAEDWLDSRDTTKPFCVVIGHKATHRPWLPDTADLGRFDDVQFPLPHNFYDNYANRKAAAMQDMTISKTMQLPYDLKMPENGVAPKSRTPRMNDAEKAKFNAYYDRIAKDFESRNLSGNALIEWKFQRYMRDYLMTAAALDRNIGRTLDYLDQHGLSNNTIVIYLSDQGFYMGEHGWFDKRFMYEESFRTPMVMRYPGVIKPGTQSTSMVMNLDIAPTVLDAAGVTKPADMQGESILPLFKKGNAKGREAMYYHYYEPTTHSVSPHFGVRTERYKLIRFYGKVDSWELFDLKKDPQEMNNLFGKKGYEKITAKLKAELTSLIHQYEDEEAEGLL